MIILTKELKRFICIIVVTIIIGIIMLVLVTVSSVRYRYENVYIDYIIADDYSYAVDAYNKSKIFSSIEKLPDSINEEDRELPVSGRLENDRSKLATCYEYEYEGLTYLEVEIYDKKIITDGSDSIFLYYVEDTQ